MGLTIRRRLADTSLLIFVGAPQPYSVNQEVFLDFIPVSTYVNQGVWRMTLRPTRLVSGNYSPYNPFYGRTGSYGRGI